MKVGGVTPLDKVRGCAYSRGMSTLTKIQKVMRVLSIVIRIVMVLSFVGGGLLAITGVVCLCAEKFTLPGRLQTLLVDVGEFSNVEVGLALLADAVLLLADGIMLIFAVMYFNTELKDGTPFTMAGAIRVRRMGIARIVATIVADLIYSFLTDFVDSNLLYSVESTGGLFFGVALILASLIFRHGAELQSQITASTQAQN